VLWSWARLREKPVAQIAEDIGISDSCLRGWIRQADIDDGRRDGLSRQDRDELAELRRELRVAKMENEILKRAAGRCCVEDGHTALRADLGVPGARDEANVPVWARRGPSDGRPNCARLRPTQQSLRITMTIAPGRSLMRRCCIEGARLSEARLRR